MLWVQRLCRITVFQGASRASFKNALKTSDLIGSFVVGRPGGGFRWFNIEQRTAGKKAGGPGPNRGGDHTPWRRRKYIRQKPVWRTEAGRNLKLFEKFCLNNRRDARLGKDYSADSVQLFADVQGGAPPQGLPGTTGWTLRR
jgi:hypothetical protein